ncbi:uncharacterized protein EDB91DRAFT_1080096 [Suillus paluster]|uniref:uncharacterized protein n=1 Tax=Suillus paluster TaxID=48578 RepID=UPI001B883621|nr:uncharacterized protein EDB91DRAFT_1080096 [Suillus paluster]KAG1745838.1 hypothetical protein EDB91DRAFT_1080096 [Suillus paluster]
MDEKTVYVLALEIIVLHPYYKLEYIKMTWEGREEQEHERAAGNFNAKDWHDEALKVVETTMEDYWKTHPSSTTTMHPLATASVASTSTTPSHDTIMVESAFDHHCCLLLEQATLDHDAGWAAELQRNIILCILRLQELLWTSVQFPHHLYPANNFFQVMLKFSWRKSLADSAQANSGIAEEVLLDEYKDFLLMDEGMVQWENEAGKVETIW